MRGEAIFLPVCVLALWTGAVLAMTGLRRILAVRAGRIPEGAFRLGESPEVPSDVSLPNRNLMNLLEMPTLFYVVCVVLYVTHRVTAGVTILAWVYVGLRLAHSAIHLTTNRVLHRLVAFALSNFVLLFLWIGFLCSLL